MKKFPTSNGVLMVCLFIMLATAIFFTHPYIFSKYARPPLLISTTENLLARVTPANNSIGTLTTTYTSDEQLIFNGKNMPYGAAQASDPDVFKINDTWFMLFTTLKNKVVCSNTQAPLQNRFLFNLYTTVASLPVGQTLNTSVSSWNILHDATGEFVKVISPGTLGSWDEDAIETPKYVIGYDPTKKSTVYRIYYTGWRRIKTGVDEYGCPQFGYRDMAIGMAEWDAGLGAWVKKLSPVIAGHYDWEKIHTALPYGKIVAFSQIGDQTVFYEPGSKNYPAVWNMYYQSSTDYNGLKTILIHATSDDGINWPVERRTILPAQPPFPNAFLPSGPYHPDVVATNSGYYFFGWIPNSNDLSKQGLWITSVKNPTSPLSNDFTTWKALIFENNGVWWHDSGLTTSATHDTGLSAASLVFEGKNWWLFYNGNRQDADGPWGSIGRAKVNSAALR